MNHRKIDSKLLGVWTNWAGDDAGLAAFWGYGIEFFENGTGLTLDWGSGVPNKMHKEPFNWELVNENIMRITFPEEVESEDVYYEVHNNSGRDGSYFKLSGKAGKEFWNYEFLYKLDRSNS